MSAQASLGLSEGSTVEVDLGGGRPALPGVVLAFLGPTILLLTREAPDLSERDPRAPAFLVRERGGRLHALRGRVGMMGDVVAFEVDDSVRGQRRLWSRVDVELDAVLAPAWGGAEVRTVTRDVSVGGALVRRQPGQPVSPRYEVTLSGEPLSGQVVAEATPARAAEDVIALRFTSIDAASSAVLVQLVMALMPAQLEQLRRAAA